jgi:hypothetical protein
MAFSGQKALMERCMSEETTSKKLPLRLVIRKQDVVHQVIPLTDQDLIIGRGKEG